MIDNIKLFVRRLHQLILCGRYIIMTFGLQPYQQGVLLNVRFLPNLIGEKKKNLTVVLICISLVMNEAYISLYVFWLVSSFPPRCYCGQTTQAHLICNNLQFIL